MRKVSISALTAGLMLCCGSLGAQTNACALTGDTTVSAADIQAAVNMTIGATTPCTANIAGPNVCNAIVVQRVINASLGQSCLSSTGLHVVTLSWTASTSAGVTGYQVFQGTSANGPFTMLATVGATTTSYTDTTVVSGTTYYYEVATVAGSSVSSPTSPFSATVPTP